MRYPTQHEQVARSFERDVIDVAFLSQRLLAHPRHFAALQLHKQHDLLAQELELAEVERQLSTPRPISGHQLSLYWRTGLNRAMRWLFDSRAATAVCSPPRSLRDDARTFFDLAMRYYRAEDAFVRLSRGRAYVLAFPEERRLQFSWKYEKGSFAEWVSFTEVDLPRATEPPAVDMDILIERVQQQRWTIREECCLMDSPAALVSLFDEFHGGHREEPLLTALKSALGTDGRSIHAFLSGLRRWSAAVRFRLFCFHHGRRHAPEPEAAWRVSPTQAIERDLFIQEMAQITDVEPPLVAHLLDEFTFLRATDDLLTRPLLQLHGVVIWSPALATEVSTLDILRRLSSDPRSSKETQIALNARESQTISEVASQFESRGFKCRTRRQFSIAGRSGDIDICAIHASRPGSALICEVKSPLPVRSTQDGESLSTKIRYGQDQVRKALSAISMARRGDLENWLPGLDAHTVTQWQGCVILEGGFPTGSVSHAEIPAVTVSTLRNLVPSDAWYDAIGLWSHLTERGLSHKVREHKAAWMRVPIGSVTCDFPVVRFTRSGEPSSQNLCHWREYMPWPAEDV